jgi:NAD(P)-dependent dehydrogenase (short-subunit alcohol dehydrogenase family)
LWRQRHRTPRCPDTARVDGALALVTGGGRGIGLETTRGLAARGAEVISASRSHPAADVPARFVPLDLGDLDSVAHCVDAIAEQQGGRPLDILVANAGLWPTRFERSAQGHEIAFATNVLGHFALIQGLIAREILAPDARIVILTGDIYVLADACTPDFEYRGAAGSQLAYCRSKLGNLWLVRELSRRHPELRVCAVHPGVIASELAGPSSGLGAALKNALLLSTEAGAQTSLWCAIWPGLVSGSYYHNTLGRLELRADDPASDEQQAEALWETLEKLAQR